MKDVYRIDTEWTLVTSEDMEVKKDIYDYDTYVFNKDFINASDIDEWVNFDFWVIEKGNPKKVIPCTLIEDECGIHFDEVLLEKVRSFTFKGDDETEEDISLPYFLFARC